MIPHFSLPSSLSGHDWNFAVEMQIKKKADDEEEEVGTHVMDSAAREMCVPSRTGVRASAASSPIIDDRVFNFQLDA